MIGFELLVQIRKEKQIQFLQFFEMVTTHNTSIFNQLFQFQSVNGTLQIALLSILAVVSGVFSKLEISQFMQGLKRAKTLLDQMVPRVEYGLYVVVSISKMNQLKRGLCT